MPFAQELALGGVIAIRADSNASALAVQRRALSDALRRRLSFQLTRPLRRVSLRSVGVGVARGLNSGQTHLCREDTRATDN
jgi:hypothetical protein